EFVVLRLEAEPRQRARQRHVDAVAFQSELDALELVLAQVAVGQHAHHFQPDMVDLDQLADRIAAAGEQVGRGLVAEYRDGRQGVVVGLGQCASVGHAQRRQGEIVRAHAAGLGVATAVVAEGGVGLDRLLGGKALGARHHCQRGARVGHAQAQAALARLAARVLVLRSRLGDQVVQAQAFDQPQRLAAAAFADRLHRHDRADAEHQSEQGQPGAQAAAPEFLDGLAPDRGQGGEQASHGPSGSVAASSAVAAASPLTVSCLSAASSPSSSSGKAAFASSTWSPGDRPDSTCERATPRAPSSTSRHSKPLPSRTRTTRAPSRLRRATLGTLIASAASSWMIRARICWPGTRPSRSAASRGTGARIDRYFTGSRRLRDFGALATQDSLLVMVSCGRPSGYISTAWPTATPCDWSCGSDNSTSIALASGRLPNSRPAYSEAPVAGFTPDQLAASISTPSLGARSSSAARSSRRALASRAKVARWASSRACSAPPRTPAWSRCHCRVSWRASR